MSRWVWRKWMGFLAMGAVCQGGVAAEGLAALADTQWQLVEFQSMDDAQGTLRSAEPGRYTMRLGSDGNVEMRLDCNRGRAGWTARPSADSSNGEFTFGPLVTTRAHCPNDRLGELVAMQAAHVRGYLIKDGRLYLSLLADGGVFVWAPLLAASFDCDKANSSAEKRVCGDVDLAGLDREMARLFRLALRGPHMAPARERELRAMQRGWIKGRDDCWKADDLRACVLDSYLMRIHELRQGYADARREDAQGISDGPLVLECADFNAGIAVSFVHGGVSHAYLRWLDRGVGVTQEPSASGVKYVGRAFDGDYLLWTHGADARFERPEGSPLTCRIMPGG